MAAETPLNERVEPIVGEIPRPSVAGRSRGCTMHLLPPVDWCHVPGYVPSLEEPWWHSGHPKLIGTVPRNRPKTTLRRCLTTRGIGAAVREAWHCAPEIPWDGWPPVSGRGHPIFYANCGAGALLRVVEETTRQVCRRGNQRSVHRLTIAAFDVSSCDASIRGFSVTAPYLTDNSSHEARLGIHPRLDRCGVDRGSWRASVTVTRGTSG